jgi:hypothetical protein
MGSQGRIDMRIASSGGGGGASGIWGISDATGTYTYYSDIKCSSIIWTNYRIIC